MASCPPGPALEKQSPRRWSGLAALLFTVTAPEAQLHDQLAPLEGNLLCQMRLLDGSPRPAWSEMLPAPPPLVIAHVVLLQLSPALSRGGHSQAVPGSAPTYPGSAGQQRQKTSHRSSLTGKATIAKALHSLSVITFCSCIQNEKVIHVVIRSNNNHSMNLNYLIVNDPFQYFFFSLSNRISLLVIFY